MNEMLVEISSKWLRVCPELVSIIQPTLKKTPLATAWPLWQHKHSLPRWRSFIFIVKYKLYRINTDTSVCLARTLWHVCLLVIPQRRFFVVLHIFFLHASKGNAIVVELNQMCRTASALGIGRGWGSWRPSHPSAGKTGGWCHSSTRECMLPANLNTLAKKKTAFKKARTNENGSLCLMKEPRSTGHFCLMKEPRNMGHCCPKEPRSLLPEGTWVTVAWWRDSLKSQNRQWYCSAASVLEIRREEIINVPNCGVLQQLVDVATTVQENGNWKGRAVYPALFSWDHGIRTR